MARLWNCAGEPIISSNTRGGVRVCVARGALGPTMVGLRPCLAGALEGLGGVAALLPLVLVWSPAMRSGRGRSVKWLLLLSHVARRYPNLAGPRNGVGVTVFLIGGDGREEIS